MTNTNTKINYIEIKLLTSITKKIEINFKEFYEKSRKHVTLI